MVPYFGRAYMSPTISNTRANQPFFSFTGVSSSGVGSLLM